MNEDEESQWLKRSERLSDKYTLGTIDAQALLIYSLGQPQREGQEGRRWLEPPCLSPALASLLQRWSSAIATLFARHESERFMIFTRPDPP